MRPSTRKIRKRLSKADYESLADFRYALRRFLKFSEAAAETIGLTPRQHQALLAIKGYPERDRVTNGELAERLQIKHQSAVGLVNRLETQDLISRTSGQDDSREVYLEVTRRGDMLLEQLAAAHQEELRRVGPRLIEMLEKLARAD
jgi:DNA-binding MarR family transcriptional regulator